MSLISRFTISAAMVAVSFLFSGCQKDDPLPIDQQIKGTATKIIYSSHSSTHSLHSVEVQFVDEDGRKCNLGLVYSNKSSKAYEGDLAISTDNFIRPETRIIAKGDVYIETTNSEEYKINVNVIPEAQLHVSYDEDGAGYKSFEITIPSNAVTTIDYGLFSDAEILDVYLHRDKLNEAVKRFLDNVKHSPYLPPEEGMGFAVDLKLY